MTFKQKLLTLTLPSFLMLLGASQSFGASLTNLVEQDENRRRQMQMHIQRIPNVRVHIPSIVAQEDYTNDQPYPQSFSRNERSSRAYTQKINQPASYHPYSRGGAEPSPYTFRTISPEILSMTGSSTPHFPENTLMPLNPQITPRINVHVSTPYAQENTVGAYSQTQRQNGFSVPGCVESMLTDQMNHIGINSPQVQEPQQPYTQVSSLLITHHQTIYPAPSMQPPLQVEIRPTSSKVAQEDCFYNSTPRKVQFVKSYSNNAFPVSANATSPGSPANRRFKFIEHDINQKPRSKTNLKWVNMEAEDFGK